MITGMCSRSLPHGGNDFDASTKRFVNIASAWSQFSLVMALWSHIQSRSLLLQQSKKDMLRSVNRAGHSDLVGHVVLSTQ